MKLAGKVAVVTGAAGGIGRAIARSLAERGCHVAIADIDEPGLAQTASMIGNRVWVTRHRLDVSDGEAILALPPVVLATHGQVDIVVNNAGVALGGNFSQLSEAEFDWLFAINFQGVVRMSRAFLPLLSERPEARIVNVSSLFGLIAPPGQSAYAASKFAVRGFSEALRHELIEAGSPVGVTVVHPGGIRTEIANKARLAAGVDPAEEARQRAIFASLLKMPPEKAGEIIVRGVEARRARILVGSDAKVASVIERLAPVRYWRLLRPKPAI